MKEFISSSSFFGLLLSLITYLLGLTIKRKFKYSFINPLLIAIVLTTGVLVLCNIEYDTYNSSARYLSYLLTPATISLALPLYEQIDKLKKNALAILIGIFSGVITSLTTVLLLSKIFGFPYEAFATFLPKSITTAIGMSVSEQLGGYVSISVTAIVLTGVLGNVICELILKIFGIKNKIAKGIAIGTASHAIGTSKAMEMGEVEGAISSLSIVVAGVMTVLLVNIFVNLY